MVGRNNRKGKEWWNDREEKPEREGMEGWYRGNRKGKEWRNYREETGKERNGGKGKNGGKVGKKQKRERMDE